MNETPTATNDSDTTTVITQAAVQALAGKWEAQEKAALAEAKLAFQQAKAAYDNAKRRVKNLDFRTTDGKGNKIEFRVTDMDAVLDLLTAPGDHSGKEPINAAIENDLIQLVQAAVRFGRNKEASFDGFHSGNTCRVTAPGRG